MMGEDTISYYEEYTHNFNEMQDEIADGALKILDKELDIIEAGCLGKPLPHQNDLVSQRDVAAAEGDDGLRMYTEKYIRAQGMPDDDIAEARSKLGHSIGYLNVMAGLVLEPQDRTGRVGFDKYIETPGRLEFVSRIFSITEDSQLVVSFPKLRKAFFSASVTFNMEDAFALASATKMLTCVQCPLQFQLYALIFRVYQQADSSLDHAYSRRKHDWWEYKMLKMVEDEEIHAPTLGKVYDALQEKHAHWMHSSEKPVSAETQSSGL